MTTQQRTEGRSPPPVMRLCLVPEFELAGVGPMPLRVQRLIALLAVADRPLSRATAASRLWPDVVNAKANASLRATLWSFSRELHPPVVIENNALSLDPRIELDLMTLRGLAASVIDAVYTGDDPLGEAALQHDLLTGWDDEWLAIERERFRQLRLHALDALCLLHARAGRHYAAIAAGLASVASEPTRESAHRALIRAHLMEGNRVEAIRQYHRYVTRARAEMGIGPSEHLQRLLQEALSDADDVTVTVG